MWYRPKNRLTTARALMLVCAALGVTGAIAITNAQVAPADPTPICTFAPNGKFNRTVIGPNGEVWPELWEVETGRGGFGEFVAQGNVDVQDAGPPQGNVLGLISYSQAEFDDYSPAGSAGQSSARVRATIDSLPATKLVFRIVGGSFHGIMYDTGDLGYSFTVIAENGATGQRFRKEVYGNRFGLCDGWGCGLGVALDGIFFPETVCIDLDPHGFSVGDPVKLYFIFESNATAFGECDEFSEFIGGVFIDDVRLCSACLSTAVSVEQLTVDVDESPIIKP